MHITYNYTYITISILKLYIALKCLLQNIEYDFHYFQSGEINVLIFYNEFFIIFFLCSSRFGAEKNDLIFNFESGF